MGSLTLLNMDYQILARTFAFRTRMHSSRMRTIRCSSGLLWGGGGCPGEVLEVFRGCLPVGCLSGDVCSGGVCLGMSAPGVSARGVCVRGVCLGVCAWQQCLPMGCLPREGSVCTLPPTDTPGTHPTVNRITDA